MIEKITMLTDKMARKVLMIFLVEMMIIPAEKARARIIPWMALFTNISSEGIKIHPSDPWIKLPRPAGAAAFEVLQKFSIASKNGCLVGAGPLGFVAISTCILAYLTIGYFTIFPEAEPYVGLTNC
jgi:hypothetical protein